jgi:hypothetical protein
MSDAPTDGKIDTYAQSVMGRGRRTKWVVLLFDVELNP